MDKAKKKVQMPSGIRNRLMAAVSMLLVASIMMVSSTYAWFTLSTAPEITGITTNVGANGNLEIALLNNASYASTEDDLGIVSNIGDSMAAANKPTTEANVTWGNLVDLSDASYGLANMVLNPAALNITDGVTDGEPDTVDSSILLAPTYGSDGRVIDVNKATYTGMPVGDYFVYDEAHAGVRVIGVSSGLSQRLSAYRTALGNRIAGITAAINAARQSLMDNGQALADIMINYAMSGAAARYDDTHVASLRAMVTSLQTANESAGEAIKAAVLAYSLSAENTTNLTDQQVLDLVAAIDAVKITATTSFDGIENVEVPAGVTATITTYLANETALATATGELDKLTDNDYTYGEISTAMSPLVNPDHITINGYRLDQAQEIKDNALEIAQNGATITMLNDSGVYANIATLAGNYTVSGMQVYISYSGINGYVNVTMKTNVTPNNTIGTITVGTAPEATVGGEGTTTILSDTYGYAVDFGFRTNAAGSNLLLQTAALQRVYNQEGYTSEASQTQGGGSYVEFQSSNPDTFSATEVQALMSAIRVVFLTPTDTGYEVLGLAAPAITRNVAADTGIVTYEGGEKSGENGWKAGLYLYNYTVGEDGVITLGERMEDESALTALEQNVAKKVTAVVYIDGDYVDNTMVANAATSVTGGLNLQFSSSADLIPMDNSAMFDGGSGMPGDVRFTEFAKEGAKLQLSDLGLDIANVESLTVKDGVTIWKGSDGLYYYTFESNPNNYVRLTISNATNALNITFKSETGG